MKREGTICLNPDSPIFKTSKNPLDRENPHRSRFMRLFKKMNVIAYTNILNNSILEAYWL